MKSLKLFSSLITLAIMLVMLLASCETDLPEQCPDLQFTITADADSVEYTITADFEGIQDLIYSWYVDDDLVETEDLDDDRDNTFNFKFAPGTYNVCIVAESAECGGRVELCEEITIKEPEEKETECPELEFEKEQVGDAKYLFEATFAGKDTIEYAWYVDGDSIESEPLGGDRFHKFDYEFRPGNHTVCIKARVEGCEELEYCKEIEIEEAESCALPEFVAEQEEGNPFVYVFTADFEGMEETQYKWYVDGELVDKENFEGIETDHELYWQFAPGTYHICTETVGTDQCVAEDFCLEITIEGEGEETCPDLFFEYDHLGDNQYKFVADFEGRNALSWYGWYIDGDLVENEGTEHGGDHFLIETFEPGVYEICLKTETDDCPEGTSYCRELVVEETQCVELSFTAEEESNGYIFTADFEERDNVTYIWKVFINDDYQGGETRLSGSDDDHDFFWQFEPGVVYEICLKQDGDCLDQQVCQEFSID